MAVGTDHGAVQADVAGIGRRDSLQLRGGEVILRDAVLLVQQLHDRQLHPAGVLLTADRAAAQQQVQRLGGNGAGQGLFGLLLAQVGQQVRDDQLGVALVGADVHLHRGAVLQGHHAVELQGDGHPLILAQATVVVGLEKGQLTVLIQGVRLQVQPGRVDVGGGDLHTLRQVLFADVGQHDGLAPVAAVQLVPGLHRHAPDERPVALGLRQAKGLRGAQALRLASIQICHIVPAVVLHGGQVLFTQLVIAVFLGGKQLFLQFLDLIALHVLFPP